MSEGKFSGFVLKLPHILSTVYVIYMSSFFLLFLHHGYFDITETKLKAFEYGTAAFLGLVLLVSAAGILLRKRTVKKLADLNGMLHRGKIPLFFAGLFAIVTVISSCISSYYPDSWAGTYARRLGGVFFILCILTAIVIAFTFTESRIVFICFIAVNAAVSFLCVLQFIGADPFSLFDNISSEQITSFISTLGNTDFAASYYSVVFPLFAVMGCCGNEKYIRTLSFISVFISTAGALCTVTDSSIVTLTAVMLLMLIISIGERSFLRRFSVELILFSSAAFAVKIISLIFGDSNYSKALQDDTLYCMIHSPVSLAVLGLLCIITLSLSFADGDLLRMARKILVFLSVLALAAGLVLFILVNCNVKLNHFLWMKITDTWGNYRGYIWRVSLEEFSDLPLMNKIFGVGPDCFGQILTEHRSGEMVSLTNSIYVDSHSEYLQMLLCFGISGLIAYFGYFISILVISLRNIKKHVVFAVSAAVFSAFLLQASVNNPQVLTTPLIFVFSGVILSRVLVE